MLLSNAPVAVVLPAKDVAGAKAFYVDKLGLKATDLPGDMALLSAGGGTMILIYAKPDGTKAEHTVAGFKVDDLDAVMKELEAKGVKFEDYDMPGLKTVNHVMDSGNGTKSAWFKDTEGNILAINQM